MEHYHDPVMYMIEKRYESTFNKLQSIQEYLVSLVDRILKVVADMNVRLGYVIDLCMRLTENSEHPNKHKTQDTKNKDK
jgi:hypothetical protein